MSSQINSMNIKDLLKEKILLLDGAMGTLIQKHKLSEEDYRGEFFADTPLPQKGNNDLLNPVLGSGWLEPFKLIPYLYSLKSLA